ncbi:MAG: histidine phosphatase family protein [Propionibacteriaceae bacterium]
MGTRRLFIARHGDADAFGELTPVGRRQAALLGARLAPLSVEALWHSPLPRAVASAETIAGQLPGVPVAAADELIDHVPYVPGSADMLPAWAGFFDGYDEAGAAEGRRTADALTARFGTLPESIASGPDVHEVLITHAFQVAWLVRHALDAPLARWLSLSSANTALTVIEHRPGLPPSVVMTNDQGHLPEDLRWTGFPDGVRP